VRNSDVPVLVVGKIKWFNYNRGYGFISSVENDDVLIHQKCLRKSGFVHVLEGATVRCEAVRCPDGLQASRILSIDNASAYSKGAQITLQAPPSAPEGPVEQGVVKWFDRAKGYGFASVGDAEDVFIHMETLRKSGIAAVQDGELLQLVVTDGSKGKHAVWVART
jgi:cold shock protein